MLSKDTFLLEDCMKSQLEETLERSGAKSVAHSGRKHQCSAIQYLINSDNTPFPLAYQHFPTFVLYLCHQIAQ